MSTAPKAQMPSIENVQPGETTANFAVNAAPGSPPPKTAKARLSGKPAATPAAKVDATESVANPSAPKVAKPAAQPASAKPAAKPLAKAFAQGANGVKPEKPVKPAKPAKAAKPPKAVMPAKVKKPRTVGERFKLLKEELAELEALKKRATKAALPAKKSTLLRAGIKALTSMSDAALAATLGSLKPTRPAAAKGKKA